MRLITWNIQHGRTNTRHPAGAGRADPEFLTDALETVASYQPDHVLLQEVDRYQYRSGWADQPRLAFEALQPHGFTWFHYTPSIVRLGLLGINPTMVPAARSLPSFGNMILSRTTPQTWKVAHLGRARTRWVGGRLPHPIPGEHRALTAAHFADGDVAVGTTHLELDSQVARTQLAKAWSLMRSFGSPAVLLGDFNLSPEGTYSAIGVNTTDSPIVADCEIVAAKPSFPATDPTIALDQAVCTLNDAGGELAINRVETLELPVSDHNALIVDISVYNHARPH
ncbi:MAG: endonuclease/exonuclease/phosphatase family protein [Actinomycetaceae bacterium]|nr:endonuclease/exonuclease/phosphatase family protein [Actinomycetaceae bacterium]